MYQIPVCIKYMLVCIEVNIYSKIDMYRSANNLFRMSFWLNCNTILAYWLMMSVCPSVRLQLPVGLFIRPSVRLSTFFFENNTWIRIQNKSKSVIQEINVWLSTTKVHVDFHTRNNCAIFKDFSSEKGNFSSKWIQMLEKFIQWVC